jgi:hypothetical protein
MRDVGIVALGFALAGCAAADTQVPGVPPAPQFQKGISTEADVVAALGKPNATLSKAGGKTTIAYWRVTSRPNAADFAPYLGASGTNAEATVAFAFGPDGKLLGFTATNSNAHTGVVN